MRAHDDVKPGTKRESTPQPLEDAAMDAVQGGLLPAVRSAPVGDAAATTGLAKTGTGTLTLSNTNTY